MLDKNLFPSGATHLLSLLNLALPGIDMNDPMKTEATLFFFTNALVTVPVADISGQLSGGMDTDRDENENDIRLSTSAFENWSLQFLDRIFRMVRAGSFSPSPSLYTHLLIEFFFVFHASYLSWKIFLSTTAQQLARKTLLKIH